MLIPTSPGSGHGTDLGVLRPQGADTPAPDGVVAQAITHLPGAFDATALLDVRLGAELSQHYTLEDALEGARELARSRGTAIGVTASSRPGSFFETYELLMPDLVGVPHSSAAWASVHQAALQLGRDHPSGRVVDGLWGVDRRNAQKLIDVVGADGTTVLGFTRAEDGLRTTPLGAAG